MWYISVLAFVVVPVLGDSSLCLSPPSIYCRSQPLHIAAIPDTDKDLQEFCFQLTEHLECLHSYDLACSEHTVFEGLSSPLDYDKLKLFLKDICEEKDSPHKVLMENLPCIKERIQTSTKNCRRERQRGIRAYRDYLNTFSRRNFNLDDPRELLLRENCLSYIATAACVIHYILRDCGFKAYDLAIHSLVHTEILTALCGFEIFQELSQQINDIPLQRELKEAIVQLLSAESGDF